MFMPAYAGMETRTADEIEMLVPRGGQAWYAGGVESRSRRFKSDSREEAGSTPARWLQTPVEGMAPSLFVGVGPSRGDSGLSSEAPDWFIPCRGDATILCGQAKRRFTGEQ